MSNDSTIQQKPKTYFTRLFSNFSSIAFLSGACIGTSGGSSICGGISSRAATLLNYDTVAKASSGGEGRETQVFGNSTSTCGTGWEGSGDLLGTSSCGSLYESGLVSKRSLLSHRKWIYYLLAVLGHSSSNKVGAGSGSVDLQCDLT